MSQARLCHIQANSTVTERLEFEKSLNTIQNFLKVNICGSFYVPMLIKISQILGLNLVHLNDKPSWWWQHPANPVGNLFGRSNMS